MAGPSLVHRNKPKSQVVMGNRIPTSQMRQTTPHDPSPARPNSIRLQPLGTIRFVELYTESRPEIARRRPNRHAMNGRDRPKKGCADRRYAWFVPSASRTATISDIRSTTCEIVRSVVSITTDAPEANSGSH